MKRLVLIALSLLPAFCLANISTNAAAMPIMVYSSEYHISGQISGAIYIGTYDGMTVEYVTKSYSGSDYTQPISDSISFGQEYPASNYLATSRAEAFHENVESHSGGLPFSLGGRQFAEADSTWIFGTTSNHLNIDFDWQYGETSRPWWAFSEIWVKDLTAGTELYHLLANYYTKSLGGHADVDLENLDLIRSYSMRMFSGAYSGDDVMGYDIKAAFSAPEPATLLLLGVGLICLAIVIRKFKN